MKISLEDAVKKYGIIDWENKVWKDEVKHMLVLNLPTELIFPNWCFFDTQIIVKKLYLNRDLMGPMLHALSNLKMRGLEKELKTFNGIYNVRTVRGTTDKPSTHAYGLAIDINAKENPLGGPIALSREFVTAFKDAGFSWGGDFTRVDAQHFSCAWE